MKFKPDILIKFSYALLFILLFTACNKDEEEIDTTPPGLVTELSAVASDGQVVLSWTEPSDPDLDQIEVGYTPGTGVTLTQAAGLNGMTVSGLDNGTQYDFTVVTVDEEGNKSNAVHITAVPNEPFVVISPNQDNYNPAGGTFTTDGSGHLIITVTFNRPVDPTTVVPAVTIYFEGDAISQGTVSFTNQNKTLTFTTTDEIGDLGTFSPDFNFDFFLIGTDVGSGFITDENGMVLDGDEDGEAGGDYELNLIILG
jgi:hypothetical protein